MRVVRTFYWHDRIVGRARAFTRRKIFRTKNAWREFAIGNAGDIFARNLIAHNYPGASALNSKEGPRLLCVGSIAHKLAPGDVLCGVGTKSGDIPKVNPSTVLLHGLRGPISQERFAAAGFDTTQVSWHGDPGLMIASMLSPIAPKPGRVIFIPHYRERDGVRKALPLGIKLVDIDADPLVVGREIQRAELVFSSSLHGIVFSHALERPVVMVKPATEEPLSKFEDYYLGVGLDMPKFLSEIGEADFSTAPISPVTLTQQIEKIRFPTIEILERRGILS